MRENYLTLLQKFNDFTPLSHYSHFTKSAFKACNREGEYLQGIFSANIDATKTVLKEFDRHLKETGVSQTKAIKAIRMRGALITGVSIWKQKTGRVYTCSNTFLNIVSRYCGYRNYGELFVAVYLRENGIEVKKSA